MIITYSFVACFFSFAQVTQYEPRARTHLRSLSLWHKPHCHIHIWTTEQLVTMQAKPQSSAFDIRPTNFPNEFQWTESGWTNEKMINMPWRDVYPHLWASLSLDYDTQKPLRKKIECFNWGDTFPDRILKRNPIDANAKARDEERERASIKSIAFIRLAGFSI